MQLEIFQNCGLKDLFLLLTPKRRRYRVTGLSMSPLFIEGDEVVVITLPYLDRPLQVNDVVVLFHPSIEDLVIIKRIRAIDFASVSSCSRKKRYFVIGDNLDASTDSRHFGWVDEQSIIGKVICRFP